MVKAVWEQKLPSRALFLKDHPSASEEWKRGLKGSSPLLTAPLVLTTRGQLFFFFLVTSSSREKKCFSPPVNSQEAEAIVKAVISLFVRQPQMKGRGEFFDSLLSGMVGRAHQVVRHTHWETLGNLFDPRLKLPRPVSP